MLRTSHLRRMKLNRNGIATCASHDGNGSREQSWFDEKQSVSLPEIIRGLIITVGMAINNTRWEVLGIELHLAGHLLTRHLSHEAQREINASRNTRRTPDHSIPGESLLHHLHIAKSTQTIQRGPVSGGSLAGEQPRRLQQKSTGAYVQHRLTRAGLLRKVGDSETEAFWAEFIAHLKERGLTGAKL
jgi:hypothetical protein